jgi:hypothetical protein
MTNIVTSIPSTTVVDQLRVAKQLAKEWLDTAHQTYSDEDKQYRQAVKEWWCERLGVVPGKTIIKVRNMRWLVVNVPDYHPGTMYKDWRGREYEVALSARSFTKAGHPNKQRSSLLLIRFGELEIVGEWSGE